MSFKVPIYIIHKPTGIIDEQGEELTVIIDTKLTQASAQVIANLHEGAKVTKMVADKAVTTANVCN